MGWDAEEFAWINPGPEWEVRKIDNYGAYHNYFGVWKAEGQK